MLKESLAAVFGLIFATALVVPPKASAEVVVGVGVGVRPAYGYVVARPRPYVYAPPVPYVAYGQAYRYHPEFYPGRVVVERPYARPYAYRFAGPRGYGWRR